jgi:hypothetical protein
VANKDLIGIKQSKKFGENINISMQTKLPFLAQQKYNNFKISVLENNLSSSPLIKQKSNFND